MKKYFGSTSLKKLLLLLQTMFDSKANKTDITVFLTSESSDSGAVDIDDSTSYATVGYVDSQTAKNQIQTEWSFNIDE